MHLPSLHSLVLLLVLTCTNHANAASISPGQHHEERDVALAPAPVTKLQVRDSPNGTYQPYRAACPAPPQGYTNGLIRDARNPRDGRLQIINPAEAAYISKNRARRQQDWITWLKSSPGPNLAIPGGVDAYLSKLDNVPRVAIAISGGGLRAHLHGAGFLAGLDRRNATAVARGTGSFLQLASYISSMSASAWLIGTAAINDWPTMQSMRDGFWNLQEDLAFPSGNFSQQTVQEVSGKGSAGYNVGIVDIYGRFLSKHFVGPSAPNGANANKGRSLLWSDIKQTSSFLDASYPFPLGIALQRYGSNGPALGNGNAQILEYNPYEFGSWDPNMAAWVPVEIIGTNLSNGVSQEPGGQCVYGLENFGYVIGSISAVFNIATKLFNVGLLTFLAQQIAGNILNDALGATARFRNPFKGYRANSQSVVNYSKLNNLDVSDLGEDGQILPVTPFVTPARPTDFILATDSAADVNNWPEGSDLYASFQRFSRGDYLGFFGNPPFPKVPPPSTFYNQKLNTRPTLFGCNSTSDVVNYGRLGPNVKAPIIAYVPNYPYSYASNFSTFKTQYSDRESQGAMDNGFETATLAGLSKGDIYWPTCLACASLQRSFERTNTKRPAACDKCFDKYCWKGVASSAPAGQYSPPVGPPSFVTSGGNSP